MKYPGLLDLHSTLGLWVFPGTSRCAFLVHTPYEAKNNYETHLHVNDFTVPYPIGIFDVVSFARVDDTALTVGCPNVDNAQFIPLSLKDGSEGTVWNIPFDARIGRWVLGQLLISARRPITERKAQEDGSWTTLDEPPIWEDGEGYRAKIRHQLFLYSYGGQPIRISPERMDIRAVSVYSNGLAYARYILRDHGGIVNEIRYWVGENRLLRRSCGDIRCLTLSNNYTFVCAPDIEHETDSASAPIQIPLDIGRASLLYVFGIAVGSYTVSDIDLQGKILCADGDILCFAIAEENPSQIYELSTSDRSLCLTLDPSGTGQLDIRIGRAVFASLCEGSCRKVYVLEGGE